MEKYMKKVTDLSIVSFLVFIIVGLFLIVRPATTLSLVSYILGLVLLVKGIISLIKYYTNKKANNLFNFGLVLGIIEIVIAVIFISKPSLVASIIPLIIGVWILVNGIFKLQFAINLKNINKSPSIYNLVVACVSILFGLILILNPFDGAVIFTQIIGAFLVVYAIVDFLQSRHIKKTLQEGVDFIK